jgi:hypothetical protein
MYVQKEGNFSFKALILVDSENIYNQGTIDNFDDAYIQTILKAHTPFKTIKGSSNKTITIAFRDKANNENFFTEFGLKIFKEQNLTIELVQLDVNKITLPMNLEVYPLFVMNHRYVQGAISKSLLLSLIEQSDYSKPIQKISLKALKEKLETKYHKTQYDINVTYNENKKLFEVREFNQTNIHSYISKDGRYILVVL